MTTLWVISICTLFHWVYNKSILINYTIARSHFNLWKWVSQLVTSSSKLSFWIRVAYNIHLTLYSFFTFVGIFLNASMLHNNNYLHISRKIPSFSHDPLHAYDSSLNLGSFFTLGNPIWFLYKNMMTDSSHNH